MVTQLLLHLLKREVTTVNPSLALAQQAVYCFNGIHLGVGVGQVRHVIAFLMDTHAQNSVLSKIYVFTVEHGLIGLRVDVYEAAVEEIREGSPQQHVGHTHLGFDNFSVGQFFVDGLEVVFEQLVVLILIIVDNGLHVVGRERTRQHVDKSECSLESLVHQVSEVVFHLLRTLDISKFVNNTR